MDVVEQSGVPAEVRAQFDQTVQGIARRFAPRSTPVFGTETVIAPDGREFIREITLRPKRGHVKAVPITWHGRILWALPGSRSTTDHALAPTPARRLVTPPRTKAGTKTTERQAAETHFAPELQPWVRYARGPNDTLLYAVIDPTRSSKVAHYQFSPDRSTCLRRVLSADGTEVLSKELIELGDHPRCACGTPAHAEFAAEKLQSLLAHTTRRLPADALADLERTPEPAPEANDDYDGGYLPSGITADSVLEWHEEHATRLAPQLWRLYPKGERRDRVLLWLLLGISPRDISAAVMAGGGVHAPALLTRLVETAADHMSAEHRQAALEALAAPIHIVSATLQDVAERFRMSDQAGKGNAPDLVPPPVGRDTTGEWTVLSPIVQRAVDRTIAFVPRLSGDRSDLLQDGMITAIQEARKLAPRAGESPETFRARLERRVETAVRHDMTDKIRHQNVANRKARELSLTADPDEDGPGLDVADPNSDPFDLVFRPHETARRDARARAIALAIYRDARGLARQIIRRAYLTAFCGLRTRGTLDFQTHPDYPAASRWLADAWSTYLGRAITGGLAPVSDRRRHRARPAAVGTAA